MIIPTITVTAATVLTAIPTIAASVNPVFPVVGVSVVALEVAAAISVLVPALVAVLVPVPVLVTTLVSTLVSNLIPVFVEMLHIIVEKTDGVEFGVIVPIDRLGRALYSIDTASVGCTPEFGESHVLSQILM
jgi:hypothetical protein